MNSKYMHDAGFINCFTDVRHLIEPQCAGQHRCEVTVAKIDAETHCNDVFKFYLEAEYECLRGGRWHRLWEVDCSNSCLYGSLFEHRAKESVTNVLS